MGTSGKFDGARGLIQVEREYLAEKRCRGSTANLIMLLNHAGGAIALGIAEQRCERLENLARNVELRLEDVDLIV